MKYIKILGLVVGAAAAFMAFVGAGTASAAALCKTDTTPCTSKVGVGGSISASLKSGTEAVLKAGFAEIKCKESTVNGTVSNAGGSGVEVSGPVTTLSFGNCSGKVTTLAKGELFLNYTTGMEGSLSSKGANVEVEQIGVTCAYGTAAKTTIGPFNSTTVTGGNPTVTANASLTKTSGGFLCASPANWTATYVVSSPNPGYVSPS